MCVPPRDDDLIGMMYVVGSAIRNMKTEWLKRRFPYSGNQVIGIHLQLLPVHS
jgi:hypothetical protein